MQHNQLGNICQALNSFSVCEYTHQHSESLISTPAVSCKYRTIVFPRKNDSNKLLCNQNWGAKVVFIQYIPTDIMNNDLATTEN